MKPICFTVEDEITGEEVEHKLPAKWVICDRCRGNGKHVNPNVDGHGISREEFDEDPDFEEAYFAGRYDVRCEADCNDGKVPAVDEENLTEAMKKTYERYLKLQDEEARYRTEDAYTRRMENGGHG